MYVLPAQCIEVEVFVHNSRRPLSAFQVGCVICEPVSSERVSPRIDGCAIREEGTCTVRCALSMAI